jgi:hypothetical protein
MPWVELYRDKEVVSDNTLINIVSVLPYAVSYALDVPEEPNGRLTFLDIEVKTFDYNEFDVHSKPLAIIVRAEDFPDRRKNLNDRREIIEIQLREFIPAGLHGFVWIRPLEGSFGEF